MNSLSRTASPQGPRAAERLLDRLDDVSDYRVAQWPLRPEDIAQAGAGPERECLRGHLRLREAARRLAEPPQTRSLASVAEALSDAARHFAGAWRDKQAQHDDADRRAHALANAMFAAALASLASGEPRAALEALASMPAGRGTRANVGGAAAAQQGAGAAAGASAAGSASGADAAHAGPTPLMPLPATPHTADPATAAADTPASAPPAIAATADATTGAAPDDGPPDGLPDAVRPWLGAARALLDELAARDEIRSFWHQTNRLELQIASAVLAHTQALDQPLDALGEALETLDAALVRWPSPSQLDSLLSRLRLVRELALALGAGRGGYAGPYHDLQRLLPVLTDEALARLVPRGALRG